MTVCKSQRGNKDVRTADENRTTQGAPTALPHQHYEIRVGCHLPDRWSEWFEGLTVSNLDAGEALLSGHLADQATLHGVLSKLRDLNLPLVSVIRTDVGQGRR